MCIVYNTIGARITLIPFVVQNMVSSRSDDLRTLAASFELPKQILECLIHCGYETVTSVAEINGVEPMQTFLRENHFLFEKSPDRACIYGTYATMPEKFSFLPKHMSVLRKFIKLCQTEKKIAEQLSVMKQQCQSVAFTQELNAQDLASCLNIIPSDELTKNYDQVPHLMCEALGSLESNSIVLPGSQCANDVTVTTSIELNTNDPFTLVQQKMEQWCSTHRRKSIRNLKCGEHYKVIVTQQVVHDFRARDVHVYEWVVSLYCCICSTQVRLQPRRKSFLISNATRHLTYCVSNKKRKSTTRKQVKKIDLQVVQFDCVDKDMEILKEFIVNHDEASEIIT